MSNKYYLNYNPVARNFIFDFYSLNENENVTRLLEKTALVVLDTFKKIAFDLANNKDRNPDELRLKLSDVSSTKTIKNLVSKIKDYSEEASVSDPKFANVKQIYLKGLSKIGDALKRMVEIDSNLEDRAIEYFTKFSNILIKEIDDIAIEKMKSINDSYSYVGKKLNESIFIGFEGRIDKLRKKLVNLISDSKGKDSKNGFGRDWSRLFAQLNQKLDVVATSKDVIGEKDRKALSTIEKDTDNLGQEYYNAKIRATEVAMKQAMTDDNFLVKFSDLNDMIEQALDLIAKGNTEEALAEISIREEMEQKDAKVNEKVFPVKLGNKDSDSKFKGAELIKSTQKALMDSFPPIKNLLQSRGGNDGKFGPASSLAIKSIQGVFGNKNMNGQLDRPLLDSLLMLDQISAENKKKIKNALDSLRTAYSLSESLRSIDEHFQLFETKYIDLEDLESEIKKNLETIDLDSAPNQSQNSDEGMANALAKMLRIGGFNKNAESEDFLRDDKTLKNAYPVDFMENWMQSLEANKDTDNKDSFFWVEKKGSPGILYAMKRINGGAKKPYNWPAWTFITKEDNETSRGEFINWYISYYKDFAGISNDDRGKIFEDYFDKIGQFEEKSDNKIIQRFLKYIEDIKEPLGNSLKSESFENLKLGYVDKKLMDTLVKISNKASQVEDSSPDLGAEDFRILALVVSMCVGSLAYNTQNDSWGYALDILKEKSLTEDIMDRLGKDRMIEDIGTGRESLLKYLIVFKNGKPEVEKTDSPKQVFLDIMRKTYISSNNLFKKHLERISLDNLENKNLPPSLKVYVVKTEI